MGAEFRWHLFNSPDVLRDGRVVFDTAGNEYRLVAWMNYHYGVVYVRFIGTPRYDAIEQSMRSIRFNVQRVDPLSL